MRVPRPGSDLIVSRPPSASTRSRSRSSPACGAAPSSTISKASAPSLSRTVTVARVPAPTGSSASSQHEVDRPRDLRWVARARRDFDRGRDAGHDRRRAQRRSEAAGLEQRRVDPLRELRRLVQRLLHVAPHLVEERLRRRADRCPPAGRASCRLTASATRCCWTPLCRSRSMLRRSASAARTSRRRDARRLSISAQPVDIPGRSRHRPPVVRHGSCPSSTPAGSSGLAPRAREANLPAPACRHRSPAAATS